MDDDFIASLRDRLRRSERTVPTSRLNRLWKTGRSAATIASSVLGNRLRGRSGEIDDLDREVVARLVTQLGELKGVAMKVGQMLGYIDPTFADEFRGLLSILQTTSPAMPLQTVEQTIREAFGERADVLVSSLQRDPIAVASIGQVHRGTLPDGTEVAVKVRHPGIAEAIRGDFRSAKAGSVFARMLAPGAGSTAVEFIDEARAAMLDECDFALEAKRQVLFRSFFAEDPVITIPEPLGEWCAPSVLTTRWAPGLSLDAFLAGDPDQRARDELGAALFRFYVGTLYRHGLFHADPHPGNYAFPGDGRLLIYDFGCVRSFDRATVAHLAALAAAVRADDVAGIMDALTRLGARIPKEEKRLEHARKLLRGFFAPLLRPGPAQIDLDTGFEAREIVRDKRALAALRLPGTFLFLLRLRFGLYAVQARLGSVVDWAGLESSWAAEAFSRAEGTVELERGAEPRGKSKDRPTT